MNITQFDSPDYKRSRKAYCAQCTFEYFISILAADDYLAKLLTYIGLSDSMIGIISSLISAAFLFQLSSIFVVQRIRSIKRTAVVFNGLSQLLFTGLYLIPFLPFERNVKCVLVVVCILLAYFCTYLVSSVIYKWANSFVAPAKRGEYSAGKEMISLISGMVFTLIIGFVIDRCESLDDLRGGFLFIASAGLLISICNFVSLMLIRRETTSGSTHTVSMRDILKNTLGNRSFVSIVILTVMWDSARYITIGFLGVYKTKDLLFTIGTIQVINIVGNLFRFLVSKPLGRYSDRTSYAHGIKLALCIAAVGFGINVFTSPSNRWFIAVYTVFYSISIAGTNQNSNNIVYSYVDSDYFVHASAIKNSIGGIAGFGASLLGSRIVSAVQKNGLTLLGQPIYAQQLLSLISFAVIIAAILFVHFVIDRQKVMKQ